MDDRRIRMEVGYGLEPVIPDAVAGTLIRDTLAPHFRAGRYAAGIEAVTDAVYARIAGETDAPGAAPARPAAPGPLPLATVLLLFLVFGVIGVAIASAARNASRRGYTAGRGGWSSYPPIFSGGWPGGWGGGGWGGSRGGGGFSGGGGRFGGGGASGSW